MWKCRDIATFYDMLNELKDYSNLDVYVAGSNSKMLSSDIGIVLPFTYVGIGQLTNPRKTDNPKGTFLFDITMENELPDYLQYDFGLNK